MVNMILDTPLKNLDWLENNCSLASPLKDQVSTLKQRLRFLRTYLICTGTSEAISSPPISVASASSFQAGAAFNEATDELSSACALPVDFVRVDSSVSYMLENVEVCELRKAYAALWEHPGNWEVNSPLINPLSSRDLIDSILENLEGTLLGSNNLVSLIKEKLEFLKEKLSFLKNLIKIAARLTIFHHKMVTFLTHVHSFATKAACFSFMCRDGELDEVIARQMDAKLSELLKKIMASSSDLMEVFIRLLKASMLPEPETAKTDEMATFVDVLHENTVESLKVRILSIYEELLYLIKFLRDLPDGPTEVMERISSDIRAAAEQAASFQVNDVKEEQVPETNLVLSRFLQRMKLIKTEIFLIELLDSGETSMVPIKDKYTAFHEGLKFLRSLPVDLPEEKEEDGKLSQHIQTLRTEVIYLIDLVHDNNLMEDTMMKLNLSLDILLLKIKLVKADFCLMGILSHEANLMSHLEDLEIRKLHAGLEFLRTFVMETTDIKANIEEAELFLLHLESVVRDSSSLISSFSHSQMTEDMASELDLPILRLFEKIKLIKAEVVLMELVRMPEVGLMVYMKDDVKTLEEGVRFLRTFLINPPVEEMDQLTLAKCEATANEATSLIFSFHEHVRKEEMASEMSRLLSGFVAKIELFKAEIQYTYLQVLFSECSENSEIDGVELIFDLLDHAKCKSRSIVFAEHHLGMLLEEFDFLNSFLTDTESYYDKHEELKDLWKYITDVAWETSCIIDLLVARDNALCYFMLWVPLATEDINLIKAKVMEMYKEKRYGLGAGSDATAGPQEIDDVVVGFEHEIVQVIDRLTRGRACMDIISIVGLGGLGKTTLAQTVYNHPAVGGHFHIRAWCCVSQLYQRREVILDILRDVVAVTSRIYDMEDGDLELFLYRNLKKKRYLIVFDDIWDIEVWNDTKYIFPDDGNGSRIMLTSRLSDLALYAHPMAQIHFGRLLTDQESWELFLKKKFNSETFNWSLMEVGQQIVKQCEGLPLAIVIMAGILASTKMEYSCWVEVADNFLPRIISDPETRLRSILEIAYHSLPDHLKPCFLYFGEFPKDKEIPARKLFRDWITKGLIQEAESKTLDDVAEGYLLDLISRNLVTISRRKYNGRVRTCRVHDYVQDFCINKQREACTTDS